MIRKYNKLVRDNIPRIIEENNEKVKYIILEDKTYKKELKKKLVEESNEVLNTKSRDELIEELADVYEVFNQIIKIEKISENTIKEISEKKRLERGGFDSKIFLESTKSSESKEM